MLISSSPTTSRLLSPTTVPRLDHPANWWASFWWWMYSLPVCLRRLPFEDAYHRLDCSAEDFAVLPYLYNHHFQPSLEVS